MSTIVSVAVPCVMVVVFVGYVLWSERAYRRDYAPRPEISSLDKLLDPYYPFADTLRDIHELPERTP
jgi:hypothetical protein